MLVSRSRQDKSHVQGIAKMAEPDPDGTTATKSYDKREDLYSVTVESRRNNSRKQRLDESFGAFRAGPMTHQRLT
jgi:hypothetical protein